MNDKHEIDKHIDTHIVSCVFGVLALFYLSSDDNTIDEFYKIILLAGLVFYFFYLDIKDTKLKEKIKSNLK